MSGYPVHNQHLELIKLTPIELMMSSNHLILCHPLLLPTSIFASISVSSNESVFHIRWPKDWSFSYSISPFNEYSGLISFRIDGLDLSISPFNEYSGLISFRIDGLDLLTVQRTCKSLLQHHSSRASIIRHSAFFSVQL